MRRHVNSPCSIGLRLSIPDIGMVTICSFTTQVGSNVTDIGISTSNWRCRETLGDYLVSRNIMGIYDVDNRAITRRLRQDGSLIGVLSTEKSKTVEELLNMSQTWNVVGVDLISGVSCEAPYEWVDRTGSQWDFNFDRRNKETFRVVAYDFGIKSNILRRLASYGCKITVVPSTWLASETLKMKPDGVLFSNGPGDPSAVPYAVETVKEIVGKVPIFGISMGHQLLGQALGGKTFKMKLVTMEEIILSVIIEMAVLRSMLRK